MLLERWPTWLFKAGIGAVLAALGCTGLAVWYVTANPLPKKAEAAPASRAQEELPARRDLHSGGEELLPNLQEENEQWPDSEEEEEALLEDDGLLEEDEALSEPSGLEEPQSADSPSTKKQGSSWSAPLLPDHD